jgi:hypothetical protein
MFGDKDGKKKTKKIQKTMKMIDIQGSVLQWWSLKGCEVKFLVKMLKVFEGFVHQL